MKTFLDFIKEDVEAKRTLILSLPTKTKKEKEVLNKTIKGFEAKYIEYEKLLKQYLTSKSESFKINEQKEEKDTLLATIKQLEEVRFLLNPSNTYFEKLGIDQLFYKLGEFNHFNYAELMNIINDLVTVFSNAGINLTANDFNYTYFVNEYMGAFLDNRKVNRNNYNQIEDIFEKVYWTNPDIIKHIEINFRRLVHRHIRQFENHVANLQKKTIKKHKILTYEECLRLLKNAYLQLERLNNESISDIVDLAITGDIDINQYFEGSEELAATYEDLMINMIDLQDEKALNKFNDTLAKLKNNLSEYQNYLTFTPFIDEFKETFEKEIKKAGTTQKEESTALKDVTLKIKELEKEIDKTNRLISGRPSLFSVTKSINTNKLKMDTLKMANDLYVLYHEHDKEFFKQQVVSILHPSFTTYELLHLYYSFDFFKKQSIKKVYDVENYDELIKMSNKFDVFATNPTNIIVNSVPVFKENNIAEVIINKYRLDNINVTEEDLDDLESFTKKIDLLLRVETISNSDLTVDKIWFIKEVEKFNIDDTK